MKNLVIIPTYNEKENVEKMIRKVFSLKTPFDLLIIEDGSPDGTADIVKKLQEAFKGKLHMIERQGKLGLGTAYLTVFNGPLRIPMIIFLKWTVTFLIPRIIGRSL